MTKIPQKEIKNSKKIMKTIEIPLTEYIELLETLLYSKKEAQEQDSSWNYGIFELETKINFLKASENKGL